MPQFVGIHPSQQQGNKKNSEQQDPREPRYEEVPYEEVPYYAPIEFAQGGAGDDEFVGSDLDSAFYGGGGSDSLRGRGGDDWLFGESGKDELQGDSGNDLIDGGEGTDIAVYQGRFEDYEITRNEDGSLQIRDLVAQNSTNRDGWVPILDLAIEDSASRDGRDTLRNIEALHFKGDNSFYDVLPDGTVRPTQTAEISPIDPLIPPSFIPREPNFDSVDEVDIEPGIDASLLFANLTGLMVVKDGLGRDQNSVDLRSESLEIIGGYQIHNVTGETSYPIQQNGLLTSVDTAETIGVLTTFESTQMML